MRYFNVLRSQVPFIQTYADAEVDEAWRPHHVVSGPPVRSFAFTPVIHGQGMWQGRQWTGQDVADRPAARRSIPHAARNAIRLAQRGSQKAIQVIGACFDRAIAGVPIAQSAAENLLAADHEEGGGAHQLWHAMGGHTQAIVSGVCCPSCACEGQDVVGAVGSHPDPEIELSAYALAYLHRADAQRRVGIATDTTSPRSIYLDHHGLL